MEENKSMRILTALGIIFVVAGHLQFDILDIGGLFPYYSFHIYIFLFVTGYFYKLEDEKHIGKYILRKAKRLLLPYYIWNLVYGILSTILYKNGIYIGGIIDFKNLLIDPILGGHQYMYNSPAWFVVALFVVELLNILIRFVVTKILELCKVKDTVKLTDLIVLAGTLIVGMVTVYCAITGHVWGLWKTPGRWLIMLPGIQFGRIYKAYIEPFMDDKLPNRNKSIPYNVIYLVVILVIQYLIKNFCAGLAISVVWCTSFANGPVIPFVTAITGIAFWYRIACLLSLIKGDFLTSIGRNSYSIMTHQFIVLFTINSVCMLLSKKGIISTPFDIMTYKTNVTYQCLYAGYHVTHLINVILCIAIPIFIHNLVAPEKTEKSI